MKVARNVAIGFVVLLLGAQFVRPDRTNPPPGNQLEIGDSEVEAILRQSCFDCHSHETRWPWYSEIAPISWQIAHHVEEGREHVNFSDWNEEKQRKRFEEICEEVEEGEMPIKGYLLLHQDAKLTSEEIATLCSWSQAREMAVASSQPGTGDEREHDEESESDEDEH